MTKTRPLGGRGNSYIQDSKHLLLRISNFFFAPLFENCEHFCHKPPNASRLGWLYAIYVNLIVLFIFMRCIVLFVRGRFFPLHKHEIYLGCIIIIFLSSLAIEGIYCINYLQANRHLVCTLIFPVVLALLAESHGNIHRKA